VLQPNEGAHQCGLQIVSAAIAAHQVPAGQCAYTTYVFKPAAPALAGVIAPPVGVYWGPGQTIPFTLPSGNPVAPYEFVGGVMFRNC
jgi:hypothetical protein